MTARGEHIVAKGNECGEGTIFRFGDYADENSQPYIISGGVTLHGNKFDWLAVNFREDVRFEGKNKIGLIMNFIDAPDIDEDDVFLTGSCYIGPKQVIDKKGEYPEAHKRIFIKLLDKVDPNDKSQRTILEREVAKIDYRILKKEKRGVLLEYINWNRIGIWLRYKKICLYDSNPGLKVFWWLLVTGTIALINVPPYSVERLKDFWDYICGLVM